MLGTVGGDQKWNIGPPLTKPRERLWGLRVHGVPVLSTLGHHHPNYFGEYISDIYQITISRFDLLKDLEIYI